MDCLSARLRKAKGSFLLKKVLLGMRNAEDTCVEAADTIDGLQEDLHAAVDVAFKRGATDWVRLNYPQRYEMLSKEQA